MRTNGYQNYLDDEILTASPVKLVHLLYGAALDSIASARRYLRLGDIRARSRAITRVMRIVTELSLSLNPAEGGLLSRNLAELYAFVETLLIKANTEQCDPPLAEAERLLGILAKAWENNARATAPPATREASSEEAYQPVSCAC
jgi:flagellar protein FliS